MKKCLLISIITILLIVSSFVDSKAAGPFETIIQFFEASKNGDVETMKLLIAGPFYENRKVLLEMNKDYPEFLKKFYDGTTVELLKYDIGNDDMVNKNHHDLYNKNYSDSNIKLNDNLKSGNNEVAVVTIRLQFTDGSRLVSEFLLKRIRNDSWKIYEEVYITKLPIPSD